MWPFKKKERRVIIDIVHQLVSKIETGALQTIMDKQRKFQEDYALKPYGVNKFGDMPVEDLVDYIKEHSIHLNQEINEMLYELPFFKPWKDYTKMTSDEMCEGIVAARKEYVDALHFFINIGIALGFAESDLFNQYMDKHKQNITRQEDGYTHDKSYRQEDDNDAATGIYKPEISSDFKPKCSVQLDNTKETFSDFVVVGHAMETGKTTILQNTDAITLGRAYQMIASAFKDSYDKLSITEKDLVDSVLKI